MSQRVNELISYPYHMEYSNKHILPSSQLAEMDSQPNLIIMRQIDLNECYSNSLVSQLTKRLSFFWQKYHLSIHMAENSCTFSLVLCFCFANARQMSCLTWIYCIYIWLKIIQYTLDKYVNEKWYNLCWEYARRTVAVERKGPRYNMNNNNNNN